MTNRVALFLARLALGTLTCTAALAQTFQFQDSFTGPVEPFWSKHGKEVMPDTPSVGKLALRTIEIDTYPRVESGTFVPSSFVRLTLKHRMLPSPSWPNYFFPHINFYQTDQKEFSFRWLRSAWAPDYCSQAGGFDKVQIRWSDGGCGISPIQSSSLYDIDTTSTIEFDLDAGEVRYFIDNASTPTWTASIPSSNRKPVNKISIVGYGWYTGHGHELDDLHLKFKADNSVPRSPLDGIDVGKDGLPWQPTLAEHSNFASKPAYWDLPPKGQNHSGTDIALSYAGADRVENDGKATQGELIIKKPVYAICDGVVVKNKTTTNAPQSFLAVSHPDCAGRDLMAYYGHMISSLKDGASVIRGSVIGSVLPYFPDGRNSHLHLTLDGLKTRSLISAKLLKCKFRSAARSAEDRISGEPDVDVTELWACKELRPKSPDKIPQYTRAEADGLQPGTLLLTRGFGINTVVAYRDENNIFKGQTTDGLLANLYIKEQAMRCQGYVQLYQLWDSDGVSQLVCRPADGDPDDGI